MTAAIASNRISAPIDPVVVAARPRERVWRCGPNGIGDSELLALLLGSGVRDRRAIDVAAELVRSAGGLGVLARSTPRELAQIIGVGEARATRLAAAFELGRRAVEISQSRKLIGRAEDIYHCVAHRLAGLAQEVFLVVGVDIRNGLLDIVECARGSVLGVEIHPREVFRPLVRMAAAGGVLVHNHPSGDPTPSPEDLELTRRLREVGTMIGIPIIDHVVVGDRTFRSIAEWMGAGD
ncbi:MAG: DNA repair protein RadC [Deltaproteobacteria bacterium]|nr:DNA repair protein RadC [Deltaproteobacteria bacterium]